jgi:ubiquinone/menaquinone biosynthesis C-methylase UbiE
MSHERSLLQKLVEEITWLDSKYVHPLFYRPFVKEIPLPRFDERDKIIDVGCGAGWITKYLAKRVPEGETVGIGISEDYIKKLNESLEKDRSGEYKNLVFRHGDAENTPFPDGYFDYAVVWRSNFSSHTHFHAFAAMISCAQ